MESLFGNKTIEKILFYLLVNEKCYATQIHRMLGTPLTPVQKALLRLENGNILASSYEGKTRVYQFNPSYPLLGELEMLLKAAFHHLSPQEKKRYYYLGKETGPKKKNLQLIDAIWGRLKQISRVTLAAKNKSKQMGWSRKGNGSVEIKHEGNTLIFQEQGQWQEGGHHYSNSFRWTIDRTEGLIGVEHLRLGANHPVFLFHLVPMGANQLESRHAHLCGNDTYFGRLKLNDLFLQLKFRTIGPRKNEEIEYLYT